jgi:small-conductance mechanosensitive channel
MPRWRLIQIEPWPARILTWLMTALAVIVGMDGLAGLISDRLGSPLSVTIVKSLFGAILSSLMIITIAQVRPFVDQNGASKPWPAWFRAVLYVLGIGSILAAISGYLSFAQFVSNQIVVTGAIVTVAYIGLLASRAISEEGGFAKTSFGRWMKAQKGVDDGQLDQFGVLTSVIINILIVITFLPFVLFQWGFQPGDLATWLNRAASGFQIGTFSFSPFAILTGALVFATGYVLTQWFKRWLDGTVMARGRVEPGVRNSDPHRGRLCRACVDGARVHLGRGPRPVELRADRRRLVARYRFRPPEHRFKFRLRADPAGRTAAEGWRLGRSGSVSGTVKKISVRATEIETFQRQTVIVPNSVFINGPVGNWTHRNKVGRVEVPVGVVFGSDARRSTTSCLRSFESIRWC